jgi:GIY-YIG catalytic domain
VLFLREEERNTLETSSDYADILRTPTDVLGGLSLTILGAAAVTQDARELEGVIDALLHPARLYSATDLSRPNPVPASPGVYAWYFDEVPPGVPIDGCHQAPGHTLLYVGIAPKETKGQGVKPSISTLRHRMRDHFTGNAEGSTLRLTLRLTLGCLLSDTLNMKLRRVGSGRRHTFTNPGEIVLDKWMARHARVAWAAVEEPWVVEKRLLLTVPLPLNLQGNDHPFVSTLKGIRRPAKQAAWALPMVVDKGGARKP